MIAWLAALLLAMQAPAPLVGQYQTHQMEVGASLELKADGSFLYLLDYGAVSEAAEGHWAAGADGLVHLDSEPLSAQAMAEMERSDAAFEDEQLVVDDGALVMRRHDILLTFYRDEQ